MRLSEWRGVKLPLMALNLEYLGKKLFYLQEGHCLWGNWWSKLFITVETFLSYYIKIAEMSIFTQGENYMAKVYKWKICMGEHILPYILHRTSSFLFVYGHRCGNNCGRFSPFLGFSPHDQLIRGHTIFLILALRRDDLGTAAAGTNILLIYIYY